METLNTLTLEEWINDKATMMLLARANKVLYDAFIESGFDKEQSLELVISLMKGAQSIKGS